MVVAGWECLTNKNGIDIESAHRLLWNADNQSNDRLLSVCSKTKICFCRNSKSNNRALSFKHLSQKKIIMFIACNHFSLIQLKTRTKTKNN